MTEPVAWTLLDTHTPANPDTRYPTRERAIAAVKAWAWLHPDQADRYTVCALIPDGLTTSEVMATAKEYLNRPPVLRAES